MYHVGKGLFQLELTYKITTIGLRKLLECSNEWMLRLVKSHEVAEKRAHLIIKESDKYDVRT